MKAWPEYAFWYEEGVVKYAVFHHIADYTKAKGLINERVIGPWYFYKPAYQWISPWMMRTHPTETMKDLTPAQVPKDILALHLLIS